MLKRIDHVEIVPKDFERSLAFYTAVLGCCASRTRLRPMSGRVRQVIA